MFEALVALMVFVLVAAALQLCLAGGWKGVRFARNEETAVRIANAQLAAAGLETGLSEGIEVGTTPDGYAWTRKIRRHVPAEDSNGDPTSIAGYWVSVSVRWPDGPRQKEKSVELQTLKIGRAE